MPSIVQINVSETLAPTPSTLQATGAVISMGATTLSTSTYYLLTQASALSAILAAPLALSSLTWSGGTVTATTTAAIPGRSSGDTMIVTVAGATPTGYNGTYKCSVTGANTFTYPLASNPGTETVAGTYTPPSQVELQSMVTTFFAQGGSQAVYVLELGPGDATTGPAALAAWITTYPGVFYSYLLPRIWDASAGLLSLIAGYEALNAKTYFFVTTTTATYTAYTGLMKCVVALVEAPGIALTEFSLAAAFQHSLAYAPSSANRMTPFAWSFLYGVTPYPTFGNSTLLTNLLTANINYVGTGAEGGIATAMLVKGTTADGNDFTWWYSADWIQINCDLAIANAVINGSNNPLNPLYYNQNGINQLQDVVVQTVQNAITYGLANGTVARAALDPVTFQTNYDDDDYEDQDVVNAVPFITYVEENPSDYGIGRYAGLQLVYIPQRGFTQIIFNINVTNLIAA